MSAANRFWSLSLIASAALALAACGGGGGDSGGGSTNTAPTDTVPSQVGAGISGVSGVTLPVGQEQDKIQLEAGMVTQIQDKTAVAEALIAAAKTTTCADAGTTGSSAGGTYSNCVVTGGSGAKYRLQSEATGGATRTAGTGTAYTVVFKQMTVDLAWPTDQGLGMAATAFDTAAEVTVNCSGAATNVCTASITGTGFTWGNNAAYSYATKSASGNVQYFGPTFTGGDANINFVLQNLTNTSGTAFVFFASSMAVYKRLSATTFDVWYERKSTTSLGDGFWLRSIAAK